MKDDCIFCKLANGQIPTNTVYEDEDFRLGNLDLFNLQSALEKIKLKKLFIKKN